MKAEGGNLKAEMESRIDAARAQVRRISEALAYDHAGEGKDLWICTCGRITRHDACPNCGKPFPNGTNGTTGG